MATQSDQKCSRQAWNLARRQLWVVSGDQLRELGFTKGAIRHRVERGRLHRMWRDVYAVGRPEFTREQRWMGATLAAGEGAMLSHESGAALWGIYPTGRRRETAGVDPIDVTIPSSRRVRMAGIRIHRATDPSPATTNGPIPVTQPLFTLVDLATVLGDRQLESAVNEADKLGLLRGQELDELPRTKGIRRLERILASHKRTDSDLERDFLRLIRKARLPERKRSDASTATVSTSTGRTTTS